MQRKVTTYSDGGSRGNPGPAAIAFLLLGEDGHPVKRRSRYLGERTNNQAEYEALIAAMQTALALGAEDVTCHLDSELVVKHLKGDYKVKDKDLMILWHQARELANCFSQIRFVNVPRTNNYIQEADGLLNATLDAIQK